MSRMKMRFTFPVVVASLIVAGSILAHSAQAGSAGREWDRGCSDAKVGSYDRSKHSTAYEEGWQSCKNGNSEHYSSKSQHTQSKDKHKASGTVGREWDRGCGDAKVGSYDRSKHSEAYEEGWQACKKK